MAQVGRVVDAQESSGTGSETPAVQHQHAGVVGDATIGVDDVAHVTSDSVPEVGVRRVFPDLGCEVSRQT